MKNKDQYIKPETELVEVIMEGIIAMSSDNITIREDEDYSGKAGVKRRDFWEN